MTSLIEWLTAQIDEDERVARAANPSPWRRVSAAHLDPLTIFGDGQPAGFDKLRNVCSLEYSWVKDGNADHITRFEPARILREVGAKRAILAATLRYEAAIDGEWGCCHDAAAIEAGLCPDRRPDEMEMLVLLAEVYSDRPGYDEAWRPAQNGEETT